MRSTRRERRDGGRGGGLEGWREGWREGEKLLHLFSAALPGTHVWPGGATASGKSL